MKLTRCPVCRSHIHIEGLIQDEAGKELLALVAKMPVTLGRFAVAYIALFRPEKSDLSNARAVKLLQEVNELCPNQQVLSQALVDTVQNIHAKRRNGNNTQPLRNHNYIKQVISSLMQDTVATSDMKESSTLEIKQSNSLSDAENQKLWKEQMQRYNQGPKE